MSANQNINQIPPKLSNEILITYRAYLIGQAVQIIFGVIAFTLVGSTHITVQNTKNPLIYFVVLIVADGFFISNLLFKRQLNKDLYKNSLADKIKGYQTPLNTRCLFLELPAFFSFISYINTRNLIFLFISGLIMFYFIAIKPTKSRVWRDLNLSVEDETGFEGLE